MTRPEHASRRWILAAAAAGLALRLAFGLGYWVGKPLTHDEREYLALATSVAAGRGFVYDAGHETGTAQQFGRAPGYPLFLAAIGATGEHESAPSRVKIAQAFIGAATVLLIGIIARQALGPRAGLAAASIAAVYPPLVWISSYVFSESLYSAVALLTVYVMQRATSGFAARRNDRRLLLALAGALTGLAILIRPAMLFFVPLAGLWLAARHRLALAVLFVAAAAAVVTPWTLRNLKVHGRFVLVASEGGVTFWTGNHPLARGDGDLAANPELKAAELEFRRAHPGLSAEALEPLYYRDAFQSIARNPAGWLALLGRKAFYTVVPVGPSYTLHSRRYWLASVISYVAILLFAAIGFKRLWISPGRPEPLLLLGLSAVIVGLVFFPQERFRIPVLDPVLVIAASATFARGDAA